MFQVRSILDNQLYIVYDVKYDRNGYPQFLVYIKDSWRTISAKNFEPV